MVACIEDDAQCVADCSETVVTEQVLPLTSGANAMLRQSATHDLLGEVQSVQRDILVLDEFERVLAVLVRSLEVPAMSAVSLPEVHSGAEGIALT